ncbi:MAG TPA: hypothetical protein VHC18_07920 [Amycolatopsis sp.]|nr:hypothetical protein [Amycolatopsis sp.]
MPLLVPSLTIPVNDLATDPQPLTTTPPPGPASTIDEGTYVVGVDIKPGTYRTGGPTRSTCYWFRLKDTSGELSAVIASDGTRGPATVTIKPSDRAFKTSGCMTWIKMD